MPPGPLAILPLPGNRSSIVWSETTKRAAEIAAMGDAAYLDVLRPRFGDFLGDIALAGKRYAYPLKLTIANQFIAPRLALVGDAAHGMHPIAGQGFNFGLRDIAALAEVIADAARRGEDIASPLVLERYQQWRRFDTMVMAVGTDSVNRLFSNDNPLLRGIRDIGLGGGQRSSRLAPGQHPRGGWPDGGSAAPDARFADLRQIAGQFARHGLSTADRRRLVNGQGRKRPIPCRNPHKRCMCAVALA